MRRMHDPGGDPSSSGPRRTTKRQPKTSMIPRTRVGGNKRSGRYANKMRPRGNVR